ncbi:MAG: sulfite exporter TauE/SafE family protein [Actinomycetota bacterium]
MEFLGLSAAAWAVAVGIVFVGAVIQSSAGFGFGIVSAPVLVVLDPALVPAVVIGMGVPASLLVIWRERANVRLATVQWVLLGRLPGSYLGALAVVALGDRALALMFAVSLLTAVGLSVAGLQVRHTAPNMAAVGLVSGAMGTATSIGGPPLALLYQRESGPDLRAAMSVLLATGSVMSLSFLALGGAYSWFDAQRTIAFYPVVLLGFAASRWTVRWLDGGYTRAAVLVFAAGAALLIGARALF